MRFNPYVQDVLKTMLKAVARLDASDVNTCIMPVDAVEAMKKVDIPVFLITCKNDTKAPLKAVRAVYDSAKGYKRLWITGGRHHFDSFFYGPEKYAYKITQFIEKFLDRRLNKYKPAKIWEDEPTPADVAEELTKTDKGGIYS